LYKRQRPDGAGCFCVKMSQKALWRQLPPKSLLPIYTSWHFCKIKNRYF
jgi:hypothetical protein